MGFERFPCETAIAETNVQKPRTLSHAGDAAKSAASARPSSAGSYQISSTELPQPDTAQQDRRHRAEEPSSATTPSSKRAIPRQDLLIEEFA
jgi:hypothetical protein